MSNSKEKATKSKVKAKNDNFVWTDDEVEVLLNVVIEYKVKRTAENVDWVFVYFKISGHIGNVCRTVSFHRERRND